MRALVLVVALAACTTSPPAAVGPRDASECPAPTPAPVRYPCPGLPCVAIASCTLATPTSLPVCECTVRALAGSSLTQDVIVSCFGAP
jgi:hypothetical protein